MNLSEERNAERRRIRRLAPLMIVCNAFLFLCMAGLGILALGGGKGLGIIPPCGDANQQIVKDYLAERVPSDTYRICQWFPATPLQCPPAAVAGDRDEPVTDRGVAQRVKLVFYGPSGARQLDTVYWIRDGKVARITQAEPVSVRQAF